MMRSAGGVPFPTEATARLPSVHCTTAKPSSAIAVSIAVSSMASARSPLRRVLTICVVITRKPPPKTYGALNEASAVMKVSSAAPTSEGRSSGSVTRRNVSNGPAPSEAAASSVAASSFVRPARVKR